MSRVRKIADLPAEMIQASDRGLCCFLEDLKIPLLHLSKALQLPETMPNKIAWAVLMEFRDRTTGLLVDEFLGQKEAFIKPLGYLMTLLPGLSGATIDGEGEVFSSTRYHYWKETPANCFRARLDWHRLLISLGGR